MSFAGWIKAKTGIEFFTGGQPIYEAVEKMGYSPDTQGFDRYLADKRDFEERGITPDYEMFVMLNKNRK